MYGWWPSAAPTGRYRPVGAVVHLPDTAIEEGRGPVLDGGILADTA
ncbi:hypothetical protein [Streptomyces olivoreticuli]|nr:hypothetical protein [Streptomyces olivoreticuli]